MAGYKLQIIDKTNNLTMNVRYENMAKLKGTGKPEIEAKSPEGKLVKQTTVYQGTPLPAGSTQRKWMDEDGKEWSKDELTFWLDGVEVEELSQTKVFEIDGFQPVDNYLNNYVIGTYYEIYPCDNGMKKQDDKDKAQAANRNQMWKLWEYLNKNQVVARGEFNPSSRGFIASDGYIRAVAINGSKWALEIGVFKEEKIFSHVQENRGPIQEPVAVEISTKKKVKMI